MNVTFTRDLQIQGHAYFYMNFLDFACIFAIKRTSISIYTFLEHRNSKKIFWIMSRNCVTFQLKVTLMIT